jgi:hypothetical protein
MPVQNVPSHTGGQIAKTGCLTFALAALLLVVSVTLLAAQPLRAPKQPVSHCVTVASKTICWNPAAFQAVLPRNGGW